MAAQNPHASSFHDGVKATAGANVTALFQRVYFISALGFSERGGGGLCSLAYLQAMTDLFPNKVVLIAAEGQCNPVGVVERLEAVHEVPERPLFQKAFYAAAGISQDRLSPAVDRLARRIDLGNALVFINSSKAGRFARLFQSRGVPVLTLFHNVERNFTLHNEPNRLLRAINMRTAGFNDDCAYRSGTGVIFLSSRDAAIMRNQYPTIQPDVVREDGYFGTRESEGVGADYEVSERDILLINCSLGLEQNVAGVMAFLDRVWPLLAPLTALRSLKLVLAGGQPDPRIVTRAVSLPRVEVVSRPSPEAMKRLFARARLCVSTIDDGSGIKVRIAEALRHGRAIVATPHSCTGYENVSPEVLIRASLSEMEQAIVHAVSQRNPSEVEQTALKEYADKLSFHAGVRKLRDTIAVVAQASRGVRS